MAATSDKVTTSAQPRYHLAALVLVVAGVMLGWSLQNLEHPDLAALPQLAAGVSPFALLYVFAQSIERVLEPVSPLLGAFLGGITVDRTGKGRQQRAKTLLLQKRNETWAEARSATDDKVDQQDKAKAAAVAQQRVEQFRANSAALAVGLASFLAMLASGYFGVFFLRTLGVTNTAVALDILVTGLAIGGGTKPLHDLITNVQKAKEAKQDPAEVAA